jgi:hypothetical protein
LVASPGVAQDSPVFLTHYHIVPRLSTLHQTGGFGGFDWRYRLRGHYDLIRGLGWNLDSSDRLGWNPGAKFANAEIWGSLISDHPHPAVVLDVDQVLNLEGLRGEQLPVGAPFDVYQFKGKTEDGSAVNLLAAVIGPWMYLRGGTEPPVGSADFFQYHIRAAARPRPFADFNDDGRVDAADYVLLRKLGSSAGADAATFADWRQQVGEQAPDLGGFDSMLNSAMGSLGPPTTVPEPAVVGLATVGGILFACRRQR